MSPKLWKPVQRNVIEYENYLINPVEDFSIFAGFSCLQPNDTDHDLDDFLHKDAERHFKDRIAVTYVLKRKDLPLIPLGFATLQNDAITLDGDGTELPEVRDYHYKAFPAVKIGRLGISIDMQCGGLGSVFLLMLKNLMLDENRTGCRYLTVDARRDKKNKVNTMHFYQKNGFSVLLCRKKTSSSIPMSFDLMTFNNDEYKVTLYSNKIKD